MYCNVNTVKKKVKMPPCLNRSAGKIVANRLLFLKGQYHGLHMRS